MTMPNFLLIGAAKSGTSSLYYYLKQHPQIYMPASRDNKEPDFFTLEGESPERLGPNGLFVMKNAVTTLAEYQQLFKDVNDEVAIGEASTSYIYSQKAPERIHHHIPSAKLIAILRDPVERAFSHFLFSLSNGREPIPDFEKTLQAEPERIAKGWSFQWHHQQRGFYCQQLKRYYDTFGSSQIRVYLFEDILQRPNQLCQDIFEFLEVDPSFTPQTQKQHNPTNVPKNQALNQLLNRPNPWKTAAKTFLPDRLLKKTAAYLKKQNLGKPKLTPKLRRQLVQVYRDDILQLQELIDRDLSQWLND
jgi:hypothetical protein